MPIGGVIVPCPTGFGLTGDGGNGAIEGGGRSWFAGDSENRGAEVVVAIAVC